MVVEIPMTVERDSEDCRRVFSEDEKYNGRLLTATSLKQLLHQIIPNWVHHQHPNMPDEPIEYGINVMLNHPLQEPAPILILGQAHQRHRPPHQTTIMQITIKATINSPSRGPKSAGGDAIHRRQGLGQRLEVQCIGIPIRVESVTLGANRERGETPKIGNFGHHNRVPRQTPKIPLETKRVDGFFADVGRLETIYQLGDVIGIISMAMHGMAMHVMGGWRWIWPWPWGCTREPALMAMVMVVRGREMGDLVQQHLHLAVIVLNVRLHDFVFSKY